MLSKRIVAIILSVAASAIILFGGWFVYERSVVAAPLKKAVNESEGIVSVGTPQLSADKVTIEVSLDPDAKLRTVYESIEDQAKDMLEGRNLELNIDEQSNDKLDAAWSAALFDVAQAMETKHYSDIPAALTLISKQFDGIEAATEMDDKNVYITLKDGDTTKFVVLPRTPSQLEVWPNA